jgi:enterochelin esterase-like enzyme
LEQRFFDSTAAHTKVSYYIYTPEVYDTNKEQRFPVIYWLHGGGGGVEHLPVAVDYFNTAIRDGKLPPLIVVFPNGMADSNWVNSKDGTVPMETVVINELIPEVDAAFRTIPDRKGRLIEGFSMGGYGAAHLGFKYPDLFGAVSIFAGGPLQMELTKFDGPPQNAEHRVKVFETVYGNDQEYFKAQSPWVLAEQNADVLRRGTKIRVVVGSADSLLPMNQAFAEHLSDLQIPHEFEILPGVGHEQLPVFHALGDKNWNFYRAFLGVSDISVTSGNGKDATAPM